MTTIDTREIDAYRQGVEITQFKHFDAGMVKIHAGEQGHVLRVNRGGMDRNYHTYDAYVEIARIDPVVHLTTGGTVIDNDMLDGKTLDGVLEPLTIRAVAGFFSTDGKFAAHGFYGSISGGSEDNEKSAAQIVNLYEFDVSSRVTRYLDMVSSVGDIATSHAHDHNPVTIKPFVDRSDILEDATMSTHLSAMTYAGTGIAAALRLMSGSRDMGHIAPREISATCGWTYDNVGGVGTDSIAFGGMTY